jgi:hypothetical protein
MATAAEAKQFIESNYDFKILEDQSYRIIFNGDDGRTQLVFVDVNDTNIQVSSPFASVEDVTPKQALTANAKFSLGMQLMGDYYIVKYFMLLADVDSSEILDGFRLAAAIADDLEKELVGADKL